MNGDSSNVWRWLAAFLAGVVLAGLPAAVVSFTAPSQSDLREINDQLVMNQIQVARLEERLVSLTNGNAAAIQDLKNQITELQTRRNG